MTKRVTPKKAARAASADAGEVDEPAARLVKYVVNRPYSAGEHYDIVDAEVTHEYEDEGGLFRLKLIDAPAGVDDDVKRVRRSDLREPGTWFEAPTQESTEPAAEEAADGDAT